MRSALVFFLLTTSLLVAADYPTAEISNNVITARFYVPDVDNGYYRGTRFDWAGVVYSLTYHDHEYFGEWQKTDDVFLHDHITGPVEEYTTDDQGLGYNEAPVGGSFVRIGVGELKKPDDKPFERFKTYEVTNHGEWYIEKGKNWIEFTHELVATESGYGYRLTKRMTLTPGKAELVIDHTLTNLGDKRIETNVYNHNFFVIDGQPTGPDFSVEFPFADRRRPRSQRLGQDRRQGTRLHPTDPCRRQHHRLAQRLRRLRRGPRLSHREPQSQSGRSSHRRQTAVASALLVAQHDALPRPYISIQASVGESDRWTLKYQFYTTP